MGQENSRFGVRRHPEPAEGCSFAIGHAEMFFYSFITLCPTRSPVVHAKTRCDARHGFCLHTGHASVSAAVGCPHLGTCDQRTSIQLFASLRHQHPAIRIS